MWGVALQRILKYLAFRKGSFYSGIVIQSSLGIFLHSPSPSSPPPPYRPDCIKPFQYPLFSSFIRSALSSTGTVLSILAVLRTLSSHCISPLFPSLPTLLTLHPPILLKCISPCLYLHNYLNFHIYRYLHIYLYLNFHFCLHFYSCLFYRMTLTC